MRGGSNVLCDTFSLGRTNVVATHGRSTTSNLGAVAVSRSQNQLTYMFPVDTECLRVFEEIINIRLEARHDLEDELALILEFGDVILIPSPARSRKTSVDGETGDVQLLIGIQLSNLIPLLPLAERWDGITAVDPPIDGAKSCCPAGSAGEVEAAT